MNRGTIYSIAVDGKLIGTAPPQGLSLLTYSYRPGNDDLHDSVRLQGQKGRVVSSTQGATLERKEPRKIDGQLADHSVWYKFKARANGRLVFDLSGSNFDTLLGVYTGANLSQLRRVTADDNSGEGRRSLVSLPVVRGTTYRIGVAGVADAGNDRAPLAHLS